ncbi:MAG: J domain-containing protein [Pseudomonadota bacterium]
MTQAYPLQWPAGKPRTASPQPSRFGTNHWSREKRISLDRAVRDLLWEIDRLGGINEVISSNLKLRKDGLPYSSQRTPDDVGIAVYFQLPDERGNMQDVCMACDRWNKQACNVWSIAKCVEALRGLERWGGGDMVQSAFTGFTALPAPAETPWWEWLGFSSETEALRGDFERAARRGMQYHHPDGPNGDAWAFDKVRKARDRARELAGH